MDIYYFYLALFYYSLKTVGGFYMNKRLNEVSIRVLAQKVASTVPKRVNVATTKSKFF